MEVQFGPNPHDEPNLLYKLQRKVNVFNTSNPLPNRGYNLVASASKYGIVFIASPDGKLAVYYLNQLIDKECDPQHLPVQLQEKPTHIAVSCNDELLAVTGGQLLVVYKVTNFQNQNVSPSLSVKCDVNPSTFVSDLKWNPCIPDTIALTFFDGTLIMLQASNGQVKKVQSKARCLCWSPKGKQLVVGNSDGMLCQYKPDLTPAKTIPAPNLFEGAPVEVLAIHWISTFQFAVVFRNATDNSRPAVTIVNTPKGGQPICVNYEDICYSMGTNRPWYYYLQGLASWNVILCSSSNSMEMATLGSADAASWLQWCQPDEARPELPLTKKQENYPVGISFDTAAVHQLPWGENEKLPPMPLLLVVSQTGLLTIFNVINLANGAPVLCAPPLTLVLPAGALISASPESAPSQPAAPALTAVLQSQPTQPLPFAQPSQPIKPLVPTPQAARPTLFPTTQPTQPLTPAQPELAKPASRIFALANAANKPSAAPQPQAFDTAPRPQNEPKPAEVKPAPLAQTAPTQAQPKAEIMQHKEAQDQNAALKAEQENANKQKANLEFKNMVIREVNEFQMDLYKFVKKTRAVQLQIHQELQSLNINMELQKLDAQSIKKDCALEELRNAVAAQKLDLVRTCAVVADARMQADAKELDQWTQADPLTTKRVDSVKKLAYYVQNQLEQAHRLLEYKWNQQADRDIKMLKPGHSMIRPILDDVYQPLVKQQEILSRQQALLKTLKNTLNECDVTPYFKSTSILRSTPFKTKDPLLNLTKNVLNMSIIEPRTVENKNSLTPQKLDALRDMLSNHKTVKIKPVNVEMRHHLAAMRVSYEKSEKEKVNAQVALIKKEPEPTPVKEELSLISKPKKTVVKNEHGNPLDQTKVTAIASQQQHQHLSLNYKHPDVSGHITEVVPAYMTKKVFSRSEQKFEQSSINTLEAPPEQPFDSNSTGYITDLGPFHKPKTFAKSQPPKALESTLVDDIESESRPRTPDSNISGTASKLVPYQKTKSKSKAEQQSMTLQTSMESFGNEHGEQQLNAHSSGHVGEVVLLKSSISSDDNKPHGILPGSNNTGANIALVPKVVKSEANQPPTASFTPINMKATAPNAARTLFGDKTKEEAAKSQTSEQPVSNTSVLKDLLQSKQVTVSKKDAPPNSFMGQKICSPSAFNFSSVIVATPTSFTSRPISELNNMFNQFSPQAFGSETNSNETGEQESAITPKPDSKAKEEKPMSNLFAMKTSTPLPSISQNVPDVLATSKTVTIKRIEPKPKSDKVDVKSKENVPSENVILSIPKVVKDEKKEPKPLGAQNTNKTIDSNSQPAVPSSSAATSGNEAENAIDLKTESTKSKNSEAASKTSITVPKPQSIFGSSTVSSAPVVTQSTTSAKTQPTSEASPIFAAAAGASTEQTEYPSIFGTPPLLSPTTTETGSIFASASSTPSSIFGTTATSMFGTSTTTTPNSVFAVTTATSVTPTTSLTSASSTASSIFGSTAKSVFGSAFATTTTTTTASALASSVSTPSSVFGNTASTPSVFGAATSSTQSDQNVTAATTASIFSTPATPSSIFGSASSTTQPSVFGGTPTQSPVFGSSATTQASIFGSSATTKASVFGSPQTTQASGFGSPQTTQASVFGSKTTQASIFGTPAQANPASVFGGASQTSVFGSQAQTSVFSSPQTTQASVFGSPTATTQASVFGSPTATTQASIFGSPTATTQASIFGSPTATTQASIFGSPTATTQASIFGSPTATTQASVFGSPTATTQASVFGTPTQTTQASVFGSSNQTSVFGTPATTANSMFGSDETLFNSVNISTTSATTQASKSIFGGSSPATSVFGNSSNNVFGGKSTFGQPDATATAIFGGASSFGQSATPATNLWGNNNNSGGGFGSSGFGQQATTQPSSVFGTGNFSGTSSGSAFGSPTQQTGGFGSGFGSSATFGQPAGFGSPASSGFGGPASFGGFSRSPSSGFGAAASFGGAPSFGGPAFGAAQGSVFGGAAATPGFGSPTQSNATFESLATQNTLTFGNLAQQTPQQSQPAPNFNTSPSFSGWRG